MAPAARRWFGAGCRLAPGGRRTGVRPHDRVGARFAGCRRPPVRAPVRCAVVDDRPVRRRACRSRNGKPRTRPRALGRRDRIPGRCIRAARTRSDRCRTDDVRAGKLRALPAQDLQRELGRRRRAAQRDAVRHDPPYPRDEPRRHGGRLCRQRVGDRRLRYRAPAAGAAARRRLGRIRCIAAHLCMAQRAHPYPDEGGDAQPSDGDLAVCRGGDRCRRRDPRRSSHWPGCQGQGRPVRVQRVQPQPSGQPAPLGTAARRHALRQARPHRRRLPDHARRPDRCSGLQQRVRPAEPVRLLPFVRSHLRWRAARLPQADHAGRGGWAASRRAARRRRPCQPARRCCNSAARAC